MRKKSRAKHLKILLVEVLVRVEELVFVSESVEVDVRVDEAVGERDAVEVLVLVNDCDRVDVADAVGDFDSDAVDVEERVEVMDEVEDAAKIKTESKRVYAMYTI